MYAAQNKAIADVPARTSVTEIAIVKVKDAADGEAARNKAIETISTWPGFVRALKLVAVNDPSLLADVVLWRSLPDARAAAEKFPSEIGLSDYREAIQDLVFVDHVSQLGDGDNWQIEPESGVLELAISSVSDANEHVAMQTKVHNHLQSKTAYVNGWRLQGSEKPALSVDMINWTNPTAAEEIAKTVMADPAYSSFFQGMEELHFFGFFTVRDAVESEK